MATSGGALPRLLKHVNWIVAVSVVIVLATLAISIGGGSRQYLAGSSQPSHAAGLASRPQAISNYGKLPLSFEPNQGQTDGRVNFISRGRGYTMFLTGDEAVLALRAGSQKSKVKGQKAKAEDRFALLRPDFGSPAPSTQSPAPDVLRMKLVGANAKAPVQGMDKLPGVSNYYIGNDPKKWRTNVPNYAKVHYDDVYPGVDLVYYGNQRQLEYDFVVAPGANPGAIALAFEGGKSKLEIGSLKNEKRKSMTTETS